MERLLDFFTPKSYTLDLFIDKHQKTLAGTVQITGKSKTSDFIKLHSVGQTIDFFKINGQTINYKLENGLLTAPAAPKSDLTLELGFHGSLKEDMQGAYLSTYTHEGREERIVSTQFESHYARECFPCIDEPAAKATFTLSITVPDEDDLVLSNMEELESPFPHNKENPRIFRGDLKGEQSVAGATRTALRASLSVVEKNTTGFSCAKKELSNSFTHRFAKTPRMSTYLLAFAIGKFNVVEGQTKSGTLVRTFAPLSQDPKLLKLPNQIAIDSLNYYETLFQTKYPLKKLDQVAIPDFEAGAMENWGLVTYRESQLLCDENSSLAVQKSAALTITHELSHQWFGNLVTMKWWNDLWLNESFATIMEYYCTDHLFPRFNVWDDFFTSDCLAALYRDAIQGVQAVREDVSDPAEIATLFDPCIVYAKGAHLMLMLIREMGEANFMKGIKDYFLAKQYKNAEADDLWRALEPYAHGFSVRDFMHAWLTQPGYPVVTDEAQQRFLLDGSFSPLQYPIPELRDDMSGHYLINLSGPEFSEALSSFKTLSKEQKLRILIDRMLLAETPIVSSASLLPLLNKFQSEASAPIWEILDNIISKFTLFLDYDSPEETKFKSYIYNISAPGLKSLGLTARPTDTINTTELRLIFIANALYSKNPDFIDSLCALYQPDLESIPADLRLFVLAAKMWRDEAEFYPIIKSAHLSATSPELKSDLRSALTKPRLPENIDYAFSLLKDPTLIKPQDHLGFLLRLRRWRYTRDRALAWLFKNWDYIYQINGEKSIEDYPRYFASTIDRETDAKAFFDFFTPLATNPILARTLNVAKNDIDSTLSLIKSDKKSVLTAIQKL